MSGFSLLLGSYRAYNGYLTGFKQFRVGWWVYTTKVGFESKSWYSTYKVDFRVFEGSRKVTFLKAIELKLYKITELRFVITHVKIQPNSLLKNHY